MTGAEHTTKEGVDAAGLANGGASRVIAVAATGSPTPHEIMELVGREGPAALDPAGLYGWYVIGREAAAVGDADAALDALERVLNCWTNPPLAYLPLWEADTRWGELRNDPRWRTLSDQKRKRIGPIYG